MEFIVVTTFQKMVLYKIIVLHCNVYSYLKLIINDNCFVKWITILTICTGLDPHKIIFVWQNRLLFLPKRQFLTDMEIMDSLIHYEHLYIHVCFISINVSLLSAKKHLVRLPNFRWGPCCLVFCFCLFLFSWLCIWIVHSRFPLLFPLNLFTYTISQRHHLSGATVFCYINARFVMYE